MLIRTEEQRDGTAGRRANQAAFETTTEADLVDDLRESAKHLVSLVTEESGRTIGHILFSPVTLPGHPKVKIMGLASMAVVPDEQRQGVGSALVRSGLEEK